MTFTFSRKKMAIPYGLFLIMFVIVPLLLIFVYAFTDKNFNFTLSNFTAFFTDGSSIATFIRSIWIGLVTTFLCLVLGYPIAFILARTQIVKYKGIIMLFILPMWVNFLIRTYATRTLFQDYLNIVPGMATTVFGMVYNFLPFMILPLYTTLLKMNKNLIEASQDLGANGVQTFLKVVFPLSMPGITSGMLMVFMPSISTFAIADILSRYSVQLIGNLINDYMISSGWNYASAISIIMLLIIGVTIFFTNKEDKEEVGGRW